MRIQILHHNIVTWEFKNPCYVKMAAEIKLTYFSGRGRAEIIRLILAAGGETGKYEYKIKESIKLLQEKREEILRI